MVGDLFFVGLEQYHAVIRRLGTDRDLIVMIYSGQLKAGLFLGRHL